MAAYRILRALASSFKYRERAGHFRIAQRFYEIGNRRAVAQEFEVNEQVVKRCARRYRALTTKEGSKK